MRREMVIHLPLPYYHSDQIVRSLFSNANTYASFGLNVPDPERYQRRLVKLFTSPDERLRSGLLSGAAWGDLGDFEKPRTMISLPNVPNQPHELVNGDGLLPDLNKIVERMYDFFHDFEITIAIGIVNPGQLLASLAQAKLPRGSVDFRQVLSREHFWFDVLGACIDEFPQLKIIVWQHELSPVLWPRVLRFVGKVPAGRLAPGCLDMASHHILQTGMDQLVRYITTSLVDDDIRAGAAIKLFLNEFPDTAKRKKPIRFSGWSEELSAAFDANYAVDVKSLARECGIQFLDNLTPNVFRMKTDANHMSPKLSEV
jgi:hypothetical protein